MVGEHSPRSTPQCDCGIPAVAHRPSHTPKAWPICECGARSENHRVKHHYVGNNDVCDKCGLAEEKHITHGPSNGVPYRYKFVGIDGEGVDRDPHKYVLLCAATSHGQKWSISNPNGLSTAECLKFIVDTLYGCRVFSYGFGYDITMILKDLPDATLYALLRPNKRYREGKLRPVFWHGYELNWLQGKLTIRKGKKRVAIWDILKFYQQSFVASLEQWNNGEWDEVIKRIQHMKDKRSKFALADLPEMTTYCQEECFTLSKLAEKLLAAHTSAGLTLKSYYGPGSTASTALSLMQIKQYQKDPPVKMQEAIASAFFGGRFEHSFMGIVKEVWGYDISSAYPYHAFNLPCLKHGKWQHIKTGIRKALKSCTTALIHYKYKGKPDDVFAPFPHRDRKGSICYPYRNEGWVWLPEYREAQRMGTLTASEAWVYNTDCSCKPFARIAQWYRERTLLGKDGQGKVIKLAVNSIYGKLAQSKGPNPAYQNWIWAGLITSGTRAQVLRAIQSAPSLSDIIAIATDGIFSRRPLHLPSPQDTGTSDLSKPLGGWEEKHYPQGMLFLKPGIYMPLTGPTHQFKGASSLCDKCSLPKEDHIEPKARGVGKRAMGSKRRSIITAWKNGRRSFTIQTDRFHGAKSSISDKGGRSKRFGQWAKYPIKINFTCPNRTEKMGLLERDGMSTPYDAAVVTPEVIMKQIQRDISYEQP